MRRLQRYWSAAPGFSVGVEDRVDRNAIRNFGYQAKQLERAVDRTTDWNLGVRAALRFDALRYQFTFGAEDAYEAGGCTEPRAGVDPCPRLGWAVGAQDRYRPDEDDDWAVSFAFAHRWSPILRTSLYGEYTGVDNWLADAKDLKKTLAQAKTGTARERKVARAEADELASLVAHGAQDVYGTVCTGSDTATTDPGGTSTNRPPSGTPTTHPQDPTTTTTTTTTTTIPHEEPTPDCADEFGNQVPCP
jgi:hypothetical protein